ncbi:rhomboid family intramembrane serine protease [Alkaliphilus sp. MSJ-5]|uniref:Rhomboid family intramembrane serine protease n=1 Tax=Alkaliphilus flagellatus TaxID=2841507 RepID=A0ABS6G472_9FIRM|nr:rhomboid family intramembrane serine protease [Alkaliphilus flagellatus]MBU5676969.1 rhomboid family intramembrane serine protease [Alkaliphilus flagellatus]
MLKKIQYNSPAILTFTILSFISLILGQLTSNFSTALLFSVYRSSLADIFFYFRLIGHVLGHADLQHFLGNFLIILLIGPILEEKYGSRVIIRMMLITAIITGILNILLFDTALLGASGIVFMLILLSSFVNTQEGKIPLTLILIIILFVGREIIDVFFANDNISQLTHIVGGLCGGIFGFYIDRRKWRISA